MVTVAVLATKAATAAQAAEAAMEKEEGEEEEGGQEAAEGEEQEEQEEEEGEEEKEEEVAAQEAEPEAVLPVLRHWIPMVWTQRSVLNPSASGTSSPPAKATPAMARSWRTTWLQEQASTRTLPTHFWPERLCPVLVWRTTAWRVTRCATSGTSPRRSLSAH
jgi:hypothetical protein